MLARQGWVVDAVDISLEGLLILKQRAQEAGVHVNLIAADLDQFDVRPASYDLVVQTFFLARSLLPRLRRWVRPGGCVYVETHLRGPDAPAHGRYALRAGELRQLFRTWEILASAEGARLEGERRIVTTSVLARKASSKTIIQGMRSRYADPPSTRSN